MLREVNVTFEATQPWISVPDFAVVNTGGKSCRIILEVNSLKPGVHYGEVLGFDSEYQKLGPIIRFPVIFFCLEFFALQVFL